MKRFLSLALRMGISAFLLWLLFSGHRFSAEVRPRLGLMGSHLPWVAAGIGCAGLTMVLEAVRLWVILRGRIPDVKAWSVLRATIVGCFFNITSLGTAGGDAYKVVALSRDFSARRVTILISLIVDHLVGFAALVILFPLFALACSGQWDAWTPAARTMVRGFGAYITGGAVIFGMFCTVSLSPRLLAMCRGRFPRFMNRPVTRHFVTTCGVLRTMWPSVLLALGVSVIMLNIFFFSFYCGLRAVGGEAPLANVMLAMPVVDLMISLPVSVSGLGVRESTFESLMRGFTGLPEATGVSASLAGWLFGVFIGLLGGLIFLMGRNSQITATAKEAAP